MSKKQDEPSVFSILSLTSSLMSFLVLGIILAPLGVAFGIAGVAKNEKLKGLGIAGIVIGSIALFVLLISLAIIATYGRYL